MTSRDRTDAAPTTRTNPLAIAALACGIVELGYPFSKGLALAGVAAIILGHTATRQIRRSGERGYRLAKAGLILGYAVVALSLLAALALLVIGSGGPVIAPH